VVEQTEMQTEQIQDQKPERNDELDIFGGLLLKLGKYFIDLYRNLFKSQNNQ